MGKAWILALGLMTTLASPASAQTFQPAIVYDVGGKADKSFNEAAFAGAERFRKETGVAFREFEISAEAQREQAFANMARRGASIVIGIGFTQKVALEKVAKQYPTVKFTLVDTTSDLPNVQSVIFLVGMLAAMASKTHKVGFVGGMDIPLIRRFALGYSDGAKHADPATEVFQNMTGSTPAAWTDPARGAELARSQIDRGADVIFAAAGTTGLGVLQATADGGKLGIGVDANQDHLHPGRMLTSMVKRVDLVVYRAFMAAKNGDWKPGIAVLGLAEDAVGYTVDEHNDKLITPEMKAKVEAARAEIIAGRLKVREYQAP